MSVERSHNFDLEKIEQLIYSHNCTWLNKDDDIDESLIQEDVVMLDDNLYCENGLVSVEIDGQPFIFHTSSFCM